MAFRFQRRITILPGLRLNVGKRGMSITLGRRGASITFGQRGTYANLGLPGTGLSYRTRIDQPGRSASAPSSRTPRPPAALSPEPDATRQQVANVVQLLEEQYTDRLTGLLRDREQGAIDWHDRALRALHAPPEDDDEAFEVYARELAQARFARRMVDGDYAAWCEVLFEELGNEALPFGFSFWFAIDDETGRIEIGVELPDVEVVPSRAARVGRNGRVAYRDLPKSIVREFYEDVCCALVLRVAHEVFRVIPDADEIYVTGFRPGIDTKTGGETRQIFLRFATDRESFSRIDLDRVDPSDAFEHLGGASAKSRGILQPLAVEAVEAAS